MSINNKTTKGVGDPLTIIVASTVIIIAIVLLYYMFMGDRFTTQQTAEQEASQEISASPVPTTSESDEIDVLEEELDALDIGELEEDMDALEQESLSL
jgi:flagellar basal body-associated protein FliL